MKLYKFTKLEYGLDIIKNNRLYLNIPEEFNDPFDCDLKTDESASREASNLIVNYSDFKDLYLLFSSGQTLDLFEPGFVKKVLEKGQLFKTTLALYPRYVRQQFIDDYIKKHKTPRNIAILEQRRSNYFFTIKKTMEDIRTRTLIYCFSTRKDSILMWSHYADKHKGVCVEFEVEPTEKDLVDVIYNEKKNKYDILTTTSMILALDFLNKQFIPADQDFNKEIMKPFYTKSNEWEYEKEVRYILSKHGHERVFKNDGNYYISSPKITSVILGCRADKNSQVYKDIVEIAKVKGIEIKYTTPNEDYFKLDESK